MNYLKINWDKQWEMHAPYFKNGFVQVCAGVKLAPGPGFGDLSHPTTNIMLKLMENQINGRDVIDIGCGSGILSLVAKKMGAKRVFGVDIDKESVMHSISNAKLNQLSIDYGQDLIWALNASKNPLILMNMIEQDQENVWPSLHSASQDIIVSGILSERKDSYLKKREELQPLRELQLNGWVGLHHSHSRHTAHSTHSTHTAHTRRH